MNDAVRTVANPEWEGWEKKDEGWDAQRGVPIILWRVDEKTALRKLESGGCTLDVARATIEMLKRKYGVDPVPTAAGDVLLYRSALLGELWCKQTCELKDGPTSNTEILFNGEAVEFTPTQYRLVAYLCKQPNRKGPVGDARDAVWKDYEECTEESSLRPLLTAIRKRLEKVGLTIKNKAGWLTLIEKR